jgi:hypothetical protein
MTAFALPDHLLIFFGLLALWCFFRFLEAGAERPRWGWLFGGAVALGLALLAKYTAGLIGAGLVATLVLVPRLRPLLGQPRLYLAGLLVVLMQAPVLVWNAQHDWASFRFLTGGRSGAEDFSGLTGYLLGILAFLGPFLLWSVGRFLFAWRGPAEERAGVVLLRVVALLSFGAWLVASLFVNILFHWNLVAYVALLPVLGAWLGRGRLLAFHMVYCGLAVCLALVNYSAVPVLAFFSQADQTSAWSFGWDEVAEAVAKARAGRKVDFVAGTDYALASPLAFAMKDPTVTSLDPATEQFDFWFDADAHAGQTGLVVSDGWRPLDTAIAAHFSKLTVLGDVTVTRFGRVVNRYRLTLAEDFAPLAGGRSEGL